jgi:hypothetical protein
MYVRARLRMHTHAAATSTGTRDGLAAKRGGLCASKSMRLRFDIETDGTQTPAPVGTSVKPSPDDIDDEDEPSLPHLLSPKMRIKPTVAASIDTNDLFAWWTPQSAPIEPLAFTDAPLPADRQQHIAGPDSTQNDDAQRTSRFIGDTVDANWYIVHEVEGDYRVRVHTGNKCTCRSHADTWPQASVTDAAVRAVVNDKRARASRHHSVHASIPHRLLRMLNMAQ